MASTVTNVKAVSPEITVEVCDDQMITFSSPFVSVAGLIGGGWSDVLTNCSVEGGAITVLGRQTASHGGEYYIGGLMGECYATISGCVSSAQVTADIEDGADSEEDALLIVNAGGLNGANASSGGCTVEGTLNVKVIKEQGESRISAGGFTGAQRYLMAEKSIVSTAMTVDCSLDPDEGVLAVGAVAGSIDFYYTTQILMYTPLAASGCQKNDVYTTLNGEAMESNIGLLPMLDGQPVGWINKGEYKITEGYVAPSNIEQLTEIYGSYLPVEYLGDGIIWILTE